MVVGASRSLAVEDGGITAIQQNKTAEHKKFMNALSLVFIMWTTSCKGIRKTDPITGIYAHLFGGQFLQTPLPLTVSDAFCAIV